MRIFRRDPGHTARQAQGEPSEPKLAEFEDTLNQYTHQQRGFACVELVQDLFKFDRRRSVWKAKRLEVSAKRMLELIQDVGNRVTKPQEEEQASS